MAHSSPQPGRQPRRNQDFVPERVDADPASSGTLWINTTPDGTPVYSATDNQRWVDQARAACERAALRGY